MDKKNKLVIGLAIAAVAILVASGAVRCSLQQGDGGASQEAAPAESAQGQQGTPGVQNGLEGITGTTWQAEDGESTLAVTRDALIVDAGEESKAIYYEVVDANATDSGVSATIAVSESPTGEKRECALVVTAGASSMRLTCDALGSSYKLETGEASIELAGTDEQLSEIFGVDDKAFAEAISQWASTRSPYATRATWSKEVWIDCEAGTYLTTFKLDDAAGTIVNVQKGPDGKLTVL